MEVCLYNEYVSVLSETLPWGPPLQSMGSALHGIAYDIAIFIWLLQSIGFLE